MDITFIGMHVPSGQFDALVLYHHLDAGKRMLSVISAVFDMHPRKGNISRVCYSGLKSTIIGLHVYTHP